MKESKVGLVGPGNVGKAFMRQWALRGHNIELVIGRNKIFRDGKEIDSSENWRKYVGGLDLLAIAIGTEDYGETEMEYIQECLDRKVKIVTAAKGASANYHLELAPYLEPYNRVIGNSAAVGGITLALRHLEEMIFPPSSILAINNASINYISSKIASGISLEEAIGDAGRLGLIEPGAKDLVGVIKAELQDSLNKSVITLNTSGKIKEFVRAIDLELGELEDGRIIDLIKESKKLRYFVSTTKNPIRSEGICFQYKTEGCHTCGAFRNLRKEPELREIADRISGAMNYFRFGKEEYYALGAGAEPTAEAMIYDVQTLLRMPFRKQQMPT